jgi:N-glycosylase/DNA lyase
MLHAATLCWLCFLFRIPKHAVSFCGNGRLPQTRKSIMILRRSHRLVVVRPISNLSMARTADEDVDNTLGAAIPVTPSPKAQKRTSRTATKRLLDTTTSTTTASKTLKRKAPSSTRKSLKKSTASSETASNAVSEKTSSSPGVLTSDLIGTINPTQPFLDLNVPPHELRPSATLTTGQCFHWQVVQPATLLIQNHDDDNKKVSAWGTHNATEFVGTVRLSYTKSVVVAIKETPTTTLYRPLTDTIDAADLHQHLRNYFQLYTALLQPLYQEWSQACPRLATIAKCIPGVRIIDQDPWECLISFICSSNNSIPRITKMLTALRREYGQKLLTIPFHNNDDAAAFEFFSFPSLDDLHQKATNAGLRDQCGMGYRAKYILETIQTLQEKGGEAYLRDTLRPLSDPVQVQQLLCEFCGVGPKVADCVALFSLQQDNAIPVDTHVWNIALRDYDSPEAALHSIQSLTPTNYQKVGNVFRERFPNRAGWAHSLLFVAELPSFRQVLPSDLIQEMDEFQRKEKEKKKQKKAKSKGERA